MIIILNGASSSGKSLLAKALQQRLTPNYLHMGIDTFIAMMPAKSNALTQANQVCEGFYWQSQEDSNGTILQRIQSGAYARQINQAYHTTVRHLASSGLHIIVDDVMDGGREQQEWRQVLAGCSCIFVGVFCAEAELARREQMRGNRILGSALEQAQRVHSDVSYDICVSTSQHTSDECARQIADYLTRLPECG